MPSNFFINKSTLIVYLTELGKEYRKLNKNPIQIVIVGGAAIFVKYSFRTMSIDLDGLFIPQSDALKQAILKVADKYGIPGGWLNDDFKYTNSYSSKIFLYSDYFRTFSNLLEVRVVDSVHLIAMKLAAARDYKSDLSDVLGILIEEKNSGNYITRDMIETACSDLYDKSVHEMVSIRTINFLNDLYQDANSWDNKYEEMKKTENINRVKLKQLNEHDEKTVSIEEILDQIRKRN